MSRFLSIVCPLLTLLLVGCVGSGNPDAGDTSDAATIVPDSAMGPKEAYAAFADNLRNGDADGAAAFIATSSEPEREAAEAMMRTQHLNLQLGEAVAEVLDEPGAMAVSGPVVDPAQIEALQEQIDGDRAVLSNGVERQAGAFRLTMVRDGGVWKLPLDQLADPMPPAQIIEQAQIAQEAMRRVLPRVRAGEFSQPEEVSTAVVTEMYRQQGR